LHSDATIAPNTNVRSHPEAACRVDRGTLVGGGRAIEPPIAERSSTSARRAIMWRLSLGLCGAAPQQLLHAWVLRLFTAP